MSASESDPQPEGFKLEQALERLDAIVRRLEGDDLELDDALRLFDEGMELLRAAERKVTESEGRLQQILSDRRGRNRSQDLDLSDEP